MGHDSREAPEASGHSVRLSGSGEAAREAGILGRHVGRQRWQGTKQEGCSWPWLGDEGVWLRQDHPFSLDSGAVLMLSPLNGMSSGTQGFLSSQPPCDSWLWPPTHPLSRRRAPATALPSLGYGRLGAEGD